MKENQANQSGTLKIQATNVYKRNYEAVQQGHRAICNEGGSGSSKTFSIAQVIQTLLLERTGLKCDIIRQTLPDLKKSAMLDFFNILDIHGLYNEKNHNKSDNIYKLNGNTVQFFGLNEGQKVRGARRDIAWLNEPNEISLDSYRQIAMRTRWLLFLDYNPSMQYHWIYDEVLGSEDTCEIHSTFMDNPFLSAAERKELEGYKDKDENYYRVFTLGKRGISSTIIYNHWKNCDKLPDKGEVIYGLDFGWSNPSVLTKIEIYDNDIYVEEKFYQSRLTDDDMISLLREHCSTSDVIYGDSEDPQAIHNIQNAGYNITGFEKGPGSVLAGIREIQKRGFYITAGSINTKKEAKSYSWKMRADGVPNKEEPVKINDHAMDAVRGALYTHTKRGNMPLWGLHVN